MKLKSNCQVKGLCHIYWERYVYFIIAFFHILKPQAEAETLQYCGDYISNFVFLNEHYFIGFNSQRS